MKTLKTDFGSFFAYGLQEDVSDVPTKLELWFGEKETVKIEGAKYIQTLFPTTNVRIFPGFDHGGYVMSDVQGYLNEVYSVIG